MENKKSGKLSLATILSYGMAYGSGYQIMGSLVGSYLMIFFTDTFGIPAAAAGVIMVLASIWDAINDPIMGVVADKTIHVLVSSVLISYGFRAALQLQLSACS